MDQVTHAKERLESRIQADSCSADLLLSIFCSALFHYRYISPHSYPRLPSPLYSSCYAHILSRPHIFILSLHPLCIPSSSPLHPLFIPSSSPLHPLLIPSSSPPHPLLLINYCCFQTFVCMLTISSSSDEPAWEKLYISCMSLYHFIFSYSLPLSSHLCVFLRFPLLLSPFVTYFHLGASCEFFTIHATTCTESRLNSFSISPSNSIVRLVVQFRQYQTSNDSSQRGTLLVSLALWFFSFTSFMYGYCPSWFLASLCPHASHASIALLIFATSLPHSFFVLVFVNTFINTDALTVRIKNTIQQICTVLIYYFPTWPHLPPTSSKSSTTMMETTYKTTCKPIYKTITIIYIIIDKRTNSPFTICTSRWEVVLGIMEVDWRTGITFCMEAWIQSIKKDTCIHQEKGERRRKKMKTNIRKLFDMKAIFGMGIYLAEDPKVAHSFKKSGTSPLLFYLALFLFCFILSYLILSYFILPQGQAWSKSVLGTRMSCVAACEVLNHPEVPLFLLFLPPLFFPFISLILVFLFFILFFIYIFWLLLICF